MTLAIRTVRLMQVVMIGTIVLYVFVGEFAARKSVPNAAAYYALTLAAIAVVGAVFVVRRTFVARSEELLRSRPQDAALIGQWRAGYIITYALCESIALFGLVLRFLGFHLSQVWAFYLAGFALLLLFGPRQPSAELGS